MSVAAPVATRPTEPARARRPVRIVHLAPGHVALDTRVFHKEARTLADAGYDVTLVALAEGDRSVDGVRIIGLRQPRNRADRFVGGSLRLLRLARDARADVYHVHDIEALGVGAALALSGARVIWDSHEDFPRLALDRPWIPSALRPLVSRAVGLLERAAVVLMWRVISAEPVGASRFPAHKTVVVRNLPLAREFTEPGPAFGERGNVLVYVGDITRQRGAREMIELVDRLPADLDARLVLIGRIGEPGLHAELQSLPGWKRVDYRGFQGRDGVRAALREARIGLVLWHPTRKHVEGAIPVKLLEYMAAGLPVVASDFPALRGLVDPCQSGILVDPLDVDEVARHVAGLLATDPAELEAAGLRARSHVLATCTWEAEAETMLDLYQPVGEA
jgi:glycosyltransferase involved in cell wall biosynthesis